MKIENLSVSYGKKEVYKNFNLDVEEDKITCILGESGCGKTTLLNAVAGLIPYEGKIEKVKTSYVFQTPRLVPNLTVMGNLKLVGIAEKDAKKMLSVVGLGDKVNAYPKTLSGGEAQRVALCRAFLFSANFLLLDEPFSSLDLRVKLSVMQMFLFLKESRGSGALFVTHDVDEALYLADRIIVIVNGAVAEDVQNYARTEYGEYSPIREKIIKTLLQN